MQPAQFNEILTKCNVSVDIYNPAKEIRISEISGTVYYEGAPIGFFEAPEVTVPGKSSSAVDIDIRATLGDSLNIMQIMSMASGFRTESLTLDISMNIKVKGGLKKKTPRNLSSVGTPRRPCESI